MMIHGTVALSRYLMVIKDQGGEATFTLSCLERSITPSSLLYTLLIFRSTYSFPPIAGGPSQKTVNGLLLTIDVLVAFIFAVGKKKNGPQKHEYQKDNKINFSAPIFGWGRFEKFEFGQLTRDVLF